MSRRDLVQAGDRELWEKLASETGKAWAAFVMFRDLGLERTLPKTVAALGGKPGLDTIQDWSARHHWFERAEAYDLHLDRRRREARETELDQAERVERGLGVLLETVAAQRLRGRGTPGDPNYVPPLDPAELDPAAVARLLAEGVRIRRLSDGQPTELLKGALMIAPAEAERIQRINVEVALPLIPEELHERYLTELQARLSGRS